LPGSRLALSVSSTLDVATGNKVKTSILQVGDISRWMSAIV
jgi:hypothetical protein